MDPRDDLEAGGREISVPLLRFERPTLDFPDRSVVTMLNALSQHIFADNK
jgi:hypothetical protein